jgi:hypothetical protein
VTRRTKVRASDLGVWDYTADGDKARWVWRYDPKDVTVLDAGGVRYGFDAADIRRVNRDSAMLLTIDATGSWATLTTRGTLGRGGTRHSPYKDMYLAQLAALKWLDRRFKVEVKV